MGVEGSIGIEKGLQNEDIVKLHLYIPLFLLSQLFAHTRLEAIFVYIRRIARTFKPARPTVHVMSNADVAHPCLLFHGLHVKKSRHVPFEQSNHRELVCRPKWRRKWYYRYL